MNISRERACWVLVFLCAGLSEAAAQGRGRVLPVDEMVQKSTVIGVGTVQSVTPKLTPGTNAVDTEIALKMTEMWRGGPLSELIWVKPGGKVGVYASSVPGHEYLVKAGEQMVVFAHPYPQGNYTAIGIHQGLYRVGPGPDYPLFRVSEFREAAGKTSALTLQGLKDQVFQALGRPSEPIVPPPQPPTPPSKEGPGPGEPPKEATASLPPARTPLAEPEASASLWAGILVLILLFAIGTGVIIFERKSAAKD